MAESLYALAAHGHERATGGILQAEEFRNFLKALGFPAEVAEQEPT